MINLLPLEEKEIIHLEKVKKKVVTIWFLFLFFIFCFILVLYAVKFYIDGQIVYQEVALEQIGKKIEDSDVKVLQKNIDTVNLTLDKLNGFYKNKIYFFEILENLSNTLPSGMQLDSVLINFPNNKKIVKISLSGFALNREILLNFKENLEAEKSFKNVYFPPINWVKPENINFAVTLETEK